MEINQADDHSAENLIEEFNFLSIDKTPPTTPKDVFEGQKPFTTIYIPKHAQEVLKAIKSKGYFAYILGGYTRDILARQTLINDQNAQLRMLQMMSSPDILPNDIDYITNCPVDILKSLFPKGTTSKNKNRSNLFRLKSMDANQQFDIPYQQNPRSPSASILPYDNFRVEEQLQQLSLEINSYESCTTEDMTDHKSQILSIINSYALTLDVFLANENGEVFDLLNNEHDFYERHIHTIATDHDKYEKNPDLLIRLARQTCRLFDKEFSEESIMALQQHLPYLTTLPFVEYTNQLLKLFARNHARRTFSEFWRMECFHLLLPNPAQHRSAIMQLGIHKDILFSVIDQGFVLTPSEIKYQHRIFALLLVPMAITHGADKAIDEFNQAWKCDPDQPQVINMNVKLRLLLNQYCHQFRAGLHQKFFFMCNQSIEAANQQSFYFEQGLFWSKTRGNLASRALSPNATVFTPESSNVSPMLDPRADANIDSPAGVVYK